MDQRQANIEAGKQKTDPLKRDETIRQLQDQLVTVTENRDRLQAEYEHQAQDLSGQVHLLQQQLKETGDWLKSRQPGGEHGVSAQSLIDAKNEIIELQKINKAKADEVCHLKEALQQRDKTLEHVIERFSASAQQFEKLKQGYIKIQGENAALREERNAWSHLTAEEREKIAAQAQTLELAELRKNLTVVTAENEVLNNRLQELVQDRTIVEEKMNTLQDQITKMSADQTSQNEEKTEIQNKLQVLLTMYHANLEDHQRHDKENKEYYQQEIDKYKAELNTMREEKTKMVEKIAQWQQSYLKLSQTGLDGADLNLELHTLRSENMTLQNNIDGLNADVLRLIQENETLRVKNQQPSYKETELTKEVTELQRKLTIALDDYNQMVVLNKECSNELDTTKEQLATSNKKVQDLQTDIDRLCEENKGLDRQMQQQREQFHQDLQVAKNNLKTLQSEVDSMTEEMRKMDTQMEQSQVQHQHELQMVQTQFENQIKLELEELKVKLHQSEVEAGSLRHTSESSVEKIQAEYSTILSGVREEYQRTLDTAQKAWEQHMANQVQLTKDYYENLLQEQRATVQHHEATEVIKLSATPTSNILPYNPHDDILSAACTESDAGIPLVPKDSGVEVEVETTSHNLLEQIEHCVASLEHQVTVTGTSTSCTDLGADQTVSANYIMHTLAQCMSAIRELNNEAPKDGLSEGRHEDELNALRTHKTSLETAIFYKDLEMSNLTAQYEDCVEQIHELKKEVKNVYSHNQLEQLGRENEELRRELRQYDSVDSHVDQLTEVLREKEDLIVQMHAEIAQLRIDLETEKMDWNIGDTKDSYGLQGTYNQADSKTYPNQQYYEDTIATLHRENANLRDRLAAAQMSVHEWEASYRAIEPSTEDGAGSAQQATVAETLSRLQERIGDLEAERKELMEKVKQSPDEQAEQWTAPMKDIEQENEALMLRLRELEFEKEREELLSYIKTFEEEKDAWKVTRGTMEYKNEELERKLKNVEDEREKLKVTLSEMEIVMQGLKVKITEDMERMEMIKELEENNSELTTLFHNSEDKTAELSQQIENMLSENHTVVRQTLILEEEKKELVKQLIALQEIQTETESKLMQQADEKGQLEKDLQNALEQIKQLENQLEQGELLRKRISEVNEYTASQEETEQKAIISELRKKLDEVQEDHLQLKNTVEEKQIERDNLMQTLNTALQNVIDLQGLIKTRDDENQQLHHTLEDTNMQQQKQLDEQEKEKTELAKSLAASQEKEQDMDSRVQKVEIVANQLRRTLSEQNQQLQHYEIQLENSKASYTQLESRLKKLIEKLKEEENLREKREQEKEQIEKMKEQLAISLTTLQTELEAKHEEILKMQENSAAALQEVFGKLNLEIDKNNVLITEKDIVSSALQDLNKRMAEKIKQFNAIEKNYEINRNKYETEIESLKFKLVEVEKVLEEQNKFRDAIVKESRETRAELTKKQKEFKAEISRWQQTVEKMEGEKAQAITQARNDNEILIVQVDQMKKQLQKWKEYEKELNMEVQESLRQLQHKELEVQKARGEIERQAEKQKHEVIHLKQKVEVLLMKTAGQSTEHAEVKILTGRLEQQHKDYELKLHQLRTEASELNRRLIDSQCEVMMLGSRVHHNDNEFKVLEDENGGLQENLKDYKQDLKARNKEIATLKQLIEQKDGQMEELIQHCDGKLLQLAQEKDWLTKELLEEKDERISDLQQEFEELMHQKASLASEVNMMMLTIAELEEQLQTRPHQDSPSRLTGEGRQDWEIDSVVLLTLYDQVTRVRQLTTTRPGPDDTPVDLPDLQNRLMTELKALGQDVKHLHNQLALVIDEREQMKQLFEDDLARMNEQIEETERQRAELEQEVKNLTNINSDEDDCDGDKTTREQMKKSYFWRFAPWKS